MQLSGLGGAIKSSNVAPAEIELGAFQPLRMTSVVYNFNNFFEI